MKKILLVLCIVAAGITGYVLLSSQSAVAPITTKNDVAPKPATQNVQPSQSQQQTQSQDQPTSTANQTNEKKPMELKIEVTKQGTGDRVIKAGDHIFVNYTGKLTDGTVFDSSIPRGVPFDFTIGQGSVIAGWEQGFIGAKVGEKRTLTVPPELGYGARGAGSAIPPNATLIFDVEVVSIQ